MQISLFDIQLIGWVLQATFQMATPLILAALGGMFSERSGVVNIGLEGMMLMGAFTAVAATYFTDNPWIGVLASIIAGGILGLIHAIVCVKLKGNQIVSGTGIILFAAGFTTVMLRVIWQQTGVSDPVIPLPEVIIPWVLGIPILGQAIGVQSPLTWIMLAFIPICWYIFYRTSFGLRLRAAGEDPSTLDTAGVNVEKMRIYGVVISGVLAGMGGAQLSIGFGSEFGKLMTGGRGFIALAALIFGNWTPLGVLGAGLFFGFLNSFQFAVQIHPSLGFLGPYTNFIQMIPFISVVVALGIIRRSIPPKAIGVPYIKEKRH